MGYYEFEKGKGCYFYEEDILEFVVFCSECGCLLGDNVLDSGYYDYFGNPICDRCANSNWI